MLLSRFLTRQAVLALGLKPLGAFCSEPAKDEQKLISR